MIEEGLLKTAWDGHHLGKRYMSKKVHYFRWNSGFSSVTFYFTPVFEAVFTGVSPHNILTAAEKSRRKNKMVTRTKAEKTENWLFLMINCSCLVRFTEILFNCVESSFIRCYNTFYLKVLAICIKKIYSNLSGSLFELGLPKRVSHFHFLPWCKARGLCRRAWKSGALLSFVGR